MISITLHGIKSRLSSEMAEGLVAYTLNIPIIFPSPKWSAIFCTGLTASLAALQL